MLISTNPPTQPFLTPCPYLLASVDHELYNSLHSLKFRAHILASPHRCDGIGQRSRLIRVGKKSIFDCIFSFLFSILLELWAQRKGKCHYLSFCVSSCRAGYARFDRGRSCVVCRSGCLPQLDCASFRPTMSRSCLHDSGWPRKEKTSSSMFCCGADSDLGVV